MNKQKAITALKKIHKGATLIDESSRNIFRVHLEAPKGHHWDGDVHCRVVGDAELEIDVTSKAEFWHEVIKDIENIGRPVQCNDDDCEGIRYFGKCEYWEAGNE